MGHDTTLHLVDPRAFGYVESLVLNPPSDADLQIEIARLLGSSSDDERLEGGQLLSEISLVQVSGLAPYLRDRNIALSLWRGFPEALIGSIADEMPRLRERYPHLTVPHRFNGNFCTGIYVPPKRVPEVLELVEEAQAPDFEKLCHVLHVAYIKQLGYWEATEIMVVDPPNREWLAPF